MASGKIDRHPDSGCGPIGPEEDMSKIAGHLSTPYMDELIHVRGALYFAISNNFLLSVSLFLHFIFISVLVLHVPNKGVDSFPP